MSFAHLGDRPIVGSIRGGRFRARRRFPFLFPARRLLAILTPSDGGTTIVCQFHHSAIANLGMIIGTVLGAAMALIPLLDGVTAGEVATGLFILVVVSASAAVFLHADQDRNFILDFVSRTLKAEGRD